SEQRPESLLRSSKALHGQDGRGPHQTATLTVRTDQAGEFERFLRDTAARLRTVHQHIGFESRKISGLVRYDAVDHARVCRLDRGGPERQPGHAAERLGWT